VLPKTIDEPGALGTLGPDSAPARVRPCRCENMGAAKNTLINEATPSRLRAADAARRPPPPFPAISPPRRGGWGAAPLGEIVPATVQRATGFHCTQASAVRLSERRVQRREDSEACSRPRCWLHLASTQQQRSTGHCLLPRGAAPLELPRFGGHGLYAASRRDFKFNFSSNSIGLT
jgi:hypothetical protein